MKLRQSCVEYMRNNKEEFVEFIVNGSEAFDDYLTNMGRSRT